MLTQKQIDQYREDGCIVVESVLTKEQLEQAHEVVEEFVERSRSISESEGAFILDTGHSREAPRLRRIQTPVLIHPLFAEIVRSPAVLDPVAQLLGPDIRYHGSKLNMKASAGGAAVEWHQDFAFYPHTNDDILAIGITLDDMGLDNGCLLAIPGSHRGPILDHHDEEGYFVGAVDPTLPEVAQAEQRPLVVPAGGMTIHHARSLHASAPNTSSRPRRLLLIELCASDAFPVARELSWDTLDEYTLRGQPARAARCTELPLFKPPYRSRAKSARSIFDIQESATRRAFAGTGT